MTCPNPACGIDMPLVRSWWLSKKKGKEAFVAPEVVADAAAPSRRRVAFTIRRGTTGAPTVSTDGTVGRTGAQCVACRSAVELRFIREEGRKGRIASQLIAVVAEVNRSRAYLPPTHAHVKAAEVKRPESAPVSDMPTQAPSFRVQAYGMTHHADLFTNRQLAALTTFSDLVGDAREQVLADALAIGMDEGSRLTDGGTDASAYADAVATYLGLAVSRTADLGNALVTWSNSRDQARNLFARQAIPMVWDFVEVSPFARAAGDVSIATESMAGALKSLPAAVEATASQFDAAQRDFRGTVVSTDPPYYDNIGYSDLSDFFYVWLRRALRPIHAELFSTMLVPKAEELVANPYRHGGAEGASKFFEDGFEGVFRRIRETARSDYPITVYYAFKQQELEEQGVASTGWATLLAGMMHAGWSITATWPIRSERSGRMISVGTNALASSVVLCLRPRNESAEATNRRGFLAALKTELPHALTEMQQGAIAPVDLAQATIGPGMAVFSRYAKVIEADGSPMTVRTALALINQALDEVLTEQDGDLDADSRFCLKWYAQFGWKPAAYGDAENMANALNVPVKRMEDGGVLVAREGFVRLIRPGDLPRNWNPVDDDRISVWEVTCHLARKLTTDGIDAAAPLMAAAGTRIDLESVQLLAYRLYELAQRKDPEDAQLFNALGTEWADLSAASQKVDRTFAQQGDLGLDAW
ncbi:hypothetical protein N866_03680 [Actinotalea ferrariae CF5-4]|uniref:DUF1156 domain-containing protein n=1 Tax=Actinotalea ferrariae CF5-4 TaxID=948458 RepID=A0A021VPH6_9CELL|nr:hypothetical protein N866_03680 [Actinotalea ferrariae CF5-4]